MVAGHLQEKKGLFYIVLNFVGPVKIYAQIYLQAPAE